MHEHISRLDTNTNDPGQPPNHGVGPGLRLLLQSFLTSVLDLPDLADNKAQPRHVTLQLGQGVWRQRHALRSVHGCQTFGCLAQGGLKLRMPSRARVDFIRFTIRVRSPTRQSRSRFGRLASSSAIVRTRAMLQWPRSPRSHPKNPRFSNSVSSRSVFARRGSRDTATLEAWIT